MKDAKKILVIDDDPDFGFFCETVLGARGYRVVASLSGREGITSFRAERPDLVILDLMMEDEETGFRVAREIGRTNGSPPILMITSMPGRVEERRDLPIAGLLAKPIKPETLAEKVGKLLAPGAGI
ncbi:MAG: response regulator [Candidatus Eisenbacteria bacterium]|nr:response regulator [Candidatus Eisenbacteria bacterium]